MDSPRRFSSKQRSAFRGKLLGLFHEQGLQPLAKEANVHLPDEAPEISPQILARRWWSWEPPDFSRTSSKLSRQQQQSPHAWKGPLQGQRTHTATAAAATWSSYTHSNSGTATLVTETDNTDNIIVIETSSGSQHQLT
ncbi:hypothetical protein ElyMa_005199200 [Elysia marginata]|uniref:Uncharacterized protein n=1 Tax=Elysia marginata TaxID=1093978 RepID=A0AAV4JXB0_9GAST|nr:hypothetical protein ElyMa_005199200 [Elysia marginata]